MLRRFISSTQKGSCSAAEIGYMSSIFYRISLFLMAVSALTFPVLLFTQEKNRSEIESGSKAGSQFPLRPLDFLFPSLLEDFGDDQTKQPNGDLGKGLWEESWGREREREGEGERERESGGGGGGFLVSLRIQPNDGFISFVAGIFAVRIQLSLALSKHSTFSLL